MGSILPIRPEGSMGSSEVAKGISSSETTAAKVGQIKLPKINQKGGGLSGRQITLLQDATELSNRIKTDWDVLAPEELAERIIELEDKVSLLKETSPAIEKIKKAAQNLHFKFVFPVALEIDTAESGVTLSFAKTIYKAANDVFKSHSLREFQGLNRIQKQEVMRYAAGGKS